VINAIHQPQTVLVLGGNSDIARAIVAKLESPALQQVILACRRPDEADLGGLDDHVSVVAVEFDATDFDKHDEFMEKMAADYGDIDIVIQAFGQLGDEDIDDPAAAAHVASVNYGGAVSSGLAVAKCLKAQGHGTLVVLSSVAGVRTRPSNFIYGSTKAGQDAFATGLGHAMHGTGVKVMTVRPGFVRSSMTSGKDEAPFTVDTEDVAEAVVKGLQRGSDVVWVPGVLRVVFGLLRYAPGFVWRKLDS